MTFDSVVDGPTSFQARPALRYPDDLYDSADGSCYRVVTIEPTQPPDGCTGADWFIYRIARGRNEITGYRRGTRAAVKAQVDVLVDGLNGRRHLSDSKPIVRARRTGKRATTFNAGLN